MADVKLTSGQRSTLELIEARLGHKVSDSLIPSIFAKLDRGIEPPNDPQFPPIFQAFKMIALDYAQWVKDFREGLLFLHEFDTEPESTKRLATRAYHEACDRGKDLRWIRDWWKMSPLTQQIDAARSGIWHRGMI